MKERQRCWEAIAITDKQTYVVGNVKGDPNKAPLEWEFGVNKSLHPYINEKNFKPLDIFINFYKYVEWEEQY